MQAVMALDQGTTSSRTLIFDAQGRLLATAQQEFSQSFPKPGWVEHDAAEIWQTQLATARQALETAGLSAADIAAIGITNQRETTVLWDRASGEPVAPAIVWQDRRTAELCDALRAAGAADHIRRRTGLEVDAYFSATKLAWLLEFGDGLRARAAAGELAFGTIDSWLIWQLTEGRVHATDATNASRTMLYDIHQGAWDPELLANFELPESLLPQVVDSSGVIGETTLFGDAIPIAGVAGDQQAALYGQGCHEPGLAKCTYGTGCFFLLQTGEQAIASENRLLTTISLRRDGQLQYALEGSVFAGGATVQWLRDGLGLIEQAADIEALAETVPDTGDVWLVPAFSGLGAPYWDGHARGTIIGLTRGTSRAHIARAALDSIALQVCDLAAAMQADAGSEAPLQELRVDGGAAANDLLMQRQADLLGLPVTRPRNTESTALGAARLAGEAVGVWTLSQDLPEATTAERIFEPQLADDERQATLKRWRQAVERSRGWAEKDGG